MTDLLLTRPSKAALPVKPVLAKDWSKTHKALSQTASGWAKQNAFDASFGQLLALPNSKGEVASYLFGLGAGTEPFAAAYLAEHLPKGDYWLSAPMPPADEATIAFAWVMGNYRFDRYKKAAVTRKRLVVSSAAVAEEANRMASAVTLVRDLVNTPASDMGPDELEAATRALAKDHAAKITVIKGKALEDGFPMVFAVGKASPRAPRMLDMTWGDSSAPKVTLVGKGVCFDTGGLNLKPGQFMLNMKKDMGGAANVLGLAQMIMGAKLNLRLRVLIPAVENSVAGNAFRPGDVLQSRKGLTVEIGNTDAEGRLVLGDALALADEEKPELLVDMATLTGAARVALGQDLPALYSDDDGFVAELLEYGTKSHDPLWHMPLWQPYMADLDSKVADLNHISAGSYGGSITAALFLSRFVENAKTYSHIDLFAWNEKPKPGRPYGGDACSIRALFGVLNARYGVAIDKGVDSKSNSKPAKKSARAKGRAKK